MTSPRRRPLPWFLLLLIGIGTLAAQPAGSVAQTRRPMTPRDLWAMGRVAAATLSPAGDRIAYTVTRYDAKTFKGRTDVWVVPVAGGEAVQLTHGSASASSPSWSPDGKSIAFVMADANGDGQVQLVSAAGGEPKALTKVAGGVGGPLVWSRDGRTLLFTS